MIADFREGVVRSRLLIKGRIWGDRPIRLDRSNYLNEEIGMTTQTIKRREKTAKFGVRKSIVFLNRDDITKSKRVLKSLHLIQLIAWSALILEDSAKSPRVRSARETGIAALAVLLERASLKEDRKQEELLLRALKRRGGYRAFLEYWSRPAAMFTRVRHSLEKLFYVYEIVQFLIRSKKNGAPPKLGINSAYRFLGKSKGERGHGPDSIEKIWLHNKDAAPLIYAFYPLLKMAARRGNQPEDILRFVDTIVSNKKRLKRMLGTAAYVADLLSKSRVRDVRLSDFVDVAPVAPVVRSFNADELKDINSYDPNAAIP